MVNLATQNLQPKPQEPEPPSSPVPANSNAAPHNVPANVNRAPQLSYKKSAGDVLFDLGVYGGLGYIANAGISLVTDRYATQLDGTWLSKAGKATEKSFAKGLSLFMREPAAITKTAKLCSNIFFLGSGGWLLLVPMKLLEDRKIPIIRKTDQLLGSGPQTPDGVEQQIQTLDNGPRQSVASLFLGRVGSYFATIAFAYPLISDWTPVGKNFTLFLNKNLSNSLKQSWKMPTTTIDGIVVPQLVQSIAYETILAGTASALHYGGSKFIAHAGHQYQHGGYPIRAIPVPQPTISQPSYEDLLVAEAPQRAAS